jgi:hypothetical protein
LQKLAPPLTSAVLSELRTIRLAAAEELKLALGKLPPALGKVRHVDLLLESIKVENSQDYTSGGPFGIGSQNDTDEIGLGLLMISDGGDVTTKTHELGQIKQGNSKTFPGLVLGSIPVRTDLPGLPKTLVFRVDAYDRDDGGYNDALKAAAGYVKSKITEELIAAGIVSAGAILGISIPPGIATFVASYVKAFIDDFVDWFSGLFKNDDDILGTHSKTITLSTLNFEIQVPELVTTGNWWPHIEWRTVKQANGPLNTPAFDWVFSGSDGRWRTSMKVQLR